MSNISTLTPYKQAILIIISGSVFMAGNKLLQLNGTIEPNPEKIWIIAATFGLFFAVANCVLSLMVNIKAEKYWTQSMFIFLGTMLILAIIASLLAGTDILRTTSFKWIFIVVIISYFVFSTVIRLIKWIVDFAQKEEWNQPKRKY